MARPSANHLAWLFVLALALLLRLAAGAWWQARVPPGETFYFGDSQSYWSLGQSIAHGDAYAYPTADYQVFRAPGYPLLLAGLFRLFAGDPPVLAARALSAALGTLAVGVIGWWTSRLFDQRAGLLAAAVAAVYPGAVAMGAFVLSEAPFCPFMLLELALWGLAWRAAGNKRAMILATGAGVAAALATLIRPSWLLFTPLALAVGLAVDGRHRRRQLLVGIALSASFALGMLPWWVRNFQVTGHFVATSLQVGASLYDGLNPAAGGSSNLAFVPEFVAQERAAEGGADGDTFEFRLDRRMAEAAMAWLHQNPGRAAQLAAVKLLRLWNVWPNEPSLSAWPLRLVVLASYTPLLALGLMGAWRFSPRGWPYVLAWLPAIYFTLLHTVFVSSIRYREPAMLAFCVLAGGVLAGVRRTDTYPGAIAPGPTA